MVRSIDPRRQFSVEDLPCVIRFRDRYWLGLVATALLIGVGLVLVASGGQSIGASAIVAGLVLVMVGFFYVVMIRPRLLVTGDGLVLYPAVRPAMRAAWISIRSVEEVQGALTVYLTDGTWLTLPDLSPGRGPMRSQKAMPELVRRLTLVKRALGV